VLTEEVKTNAYPRASMENLANPNNEGDPLNYIPYYSNTNYPVDGTVRELKSATANPPVSGTTDPNNHWAKLSNQAGGRKTGPGILIKVMAGDKIELACEMWWRGTVSGNTTNQSPVADILLQLAAGLTGQIGGSKITAAQTGTNGSFFTPAVNGFITNQNPQQANKPKAFLNWLVLDEQFNYKNGNGSGAEPVGTSDQYKSYARLGSEAISIIQSGYVYIYTSNESSVAAFFDNLAVNHITGPLLEETHYYPFGLTMAGISSKAAGSLANKKQYAGNELQNKEFNDGSGLELYDFNARTYDHQIGRFIQIDPMTDEGGQESLTPFQYCGNNPILNSDPDGKFFFVLPIVYYAVAAGVAAVGTYIAVKHPINVAGAVNNLKQTINAKLNSESTEQKDESKIQTGEASGSANESASASEDNKLDGSFSLTKEKMATFPGTQEAAPQNKFKILLGEEYLKNRSAANNDNSKTHKKDPTIKGKEIHEKNPVKLNGDPVDPANKITLTPKEHAAISSWFRTILKEVKQLEPKAPKK